MGINFSSWFVLLRWQLMCCFYKEKLEFCKSCRFLLLTLINMLWDFSCRQKNVLVRANGRPKMCWEGEKCQYKFCNHYHKLQSIFAIITQHPQATSSVNGSCHKSQRANWEQLKNWEKYAWLTLESPDALYSAKPPIKFEIGWCKSQTLQQTK